MMCDKRRGTVGKVDESDQTQDDGDVRNGSEADDGNREEDDV